MSQPLPCGREVPRWSMLPLQPATVAGMASTAGLPAGSAIGRRLVASGDNSLVGADVAAAALRPGSAALVDAALAARHGSRNGINGRAAGGQRHRAASCRQW